MKGIEKKLIFFVLVICGLLLWQYYTSRFRYERDPMEGNPAPLFEAATLDGQKIRLQDLIGKKVVLVNFWATWCAPCQEEMPVLNSIQKSLDPGRFEIIALMEDDKPTTDELRRDLARFQKKIPINFAVHLDKDGLIAELYGTYKIPESFLIDLSGNVASHFAGSVSEWEKDGLIKKVNTLLGLAPTP